MIKLAVLDLDNTLLSTDKTLSDANIQAVKNLRKSGISVAIATGRGIEMTEPFANQIGLYEGPVVTNNGAIILDLSDKRILKEYIISKPAQAKMIAFAYENGYPFIVYNIEGIHSLENERLKVYEAWNIKYPDYEMPVTITENIKRLKTMDAHKILIIIKDVDAFNEALETYADLRGGSVTKSHDTFLDVIPEKGHKGEGIRFLMDYYNVSKDEVVVFGDNDNDVQMLEQIPLSFAMKNATIKAKQAATHVTECDNNASGVAVSLEKLLKIK
jgi:Cof subfamily protein (haloacid dehalogenase superfamily)